jgi:hypothetical protein
MLIGLRAWTPIRGTLVELQGRMPQPDLAGSVQNHIPNIAAEARNRSRQGHEPDVLKHMANRNHSSMHPSAPDLDLG